MTDSTGTFKYTLSNNNDGVTIHKYIGNAEDVIVPSEIDGLQVIEIGDVAFEHNEQLKSVVLPDSVVSIGDYAFAGCAGLRSVEFGGDITYIGDYAFSECTHLNDINVPSGDTLGGNVFSI